MNGILRYTLPVCLLGVTLCVGAPEALAAKSQRPRQANVGAASKSVSPVAKNPKSAVSEEVRGIVAGAVMVALTERLNDNRLQIRLKAVESARREGAAELLTGVGEFKLNADTSWVSFRFSTRFVASEASASYPSIELGESSAVPQRVLNDPRLIRELENRICEQMARESESKDVRLLLGEIETIRAGQLLTITIVAAADLDSMWARKVRIEGQYDERNQRWLGSSYLFDNISGHLAGRSL